MPAFDPDISEPEANDGERLLAALSPVPTSVDDVIRHTRLHPSQVLTLLLELDLAGRIERHSGGAVSLIAPDA